MAIVLTVQLDGMNRSGTRCKVDANQKLLTVCVWVSERENTMSQISLFLIKISLKS
jgi:hypothetical protein